MAKSDDIHPDWIPATPDTVPPSGWILVRDVATLQDYWADSTFPQAKKLSHLERVCDRYRQRRFGQ